jgi:hypothetical protein
MTTDYKPPGWLPKWPWWVWLLVALFPIPLKPWWLTIISLSLFCLLAWLFKPKIEKPLAHDEILGSMLLPLADEFEAGNGRGRVPALTEYQSVRKCLATLMGPLIGGFLASGSLGHIPTIPFIRTWLTEIQVDREDLVSIGYGRNPHLSRSTVEHYCGEVPRDTLKPRRPCVKSHVIADFTEP